MKLRPDTTGMSTPRAMWAWRSVPLLAPIWVYKRYLSPVLPPACRHLPTCSEYCFDAIRQRGIAQGSLMGLWRLLRCQPFGTSGYDPVEAFTWPWQKRQEVEAIDDTAEFMHPRQDAKTPRDAMAPAE